MVWGLPEGVRGAGWKGQKGGKNGWTVISQSIKYNFLKKVKVPQAHTQQLLWCWCPRRTVLPFMNPNLRRAWWWQRRVCTCPNTPSCQTRTCLISPSGRLCNLSNHEAAQRNSLPGDISTGILLTRACSISVFTSTCSQDRACYFGRPRPKGLEGERPARLTGGEADRDT